MGKFQSSTHHEHQISASNQKRVLANGDYDDNAEMPKKERAEEVLNMSQKRPAMERYRLQVDRQTKASFPTQAPRRESGSCNQESAPQVHVSVYDAEGSKTTVL